MIAFLIFSILNHPPVAESIMASGFVSGGTTDKPTERDDEWLKAQQEIEANRRRKEEESRQQGGKSLYEVLQNNKGDYPRLLLHPHLGQVIAIY